MLFKSEIVTQVSGSIGGVTYSHNRSGMYRRSRTIPVDPQTTFQSQVRSAFTFMINSWQSISQAERDAWDLYAENVPVTNALGDSVFNSGQNWYVACNTPRFQALVKLGGAEARVDPGPTIFNRGDFTPPGAIWGEAAGLAVAFDDTDAWANEDEAFMWIYQGRPQNAGVKFFKGPWRLVASIEGDSITPPTTPLVLSAATLTAEGYTITEGQSSSLAVAVGRADGRLASRVIVGPQLVIA